MLFISYYLICLPRRWFSGGLNQVIKLLVTLNFYELQHKQAYTRNYLVRKIWMIKITRSIIISLGFWVADKR